MSGKTPEAAPLKKEVSIEPPPAVQEPAVVETPEPEAPAGDQYIFELKNGKEIRGGIVKETEKSFTVRFSGNTIVFEKTEIESYRKAE
jgi:hypothetical protein